MEMVCTTYLLNAPTDIYIITNKIGRTCRLLCTLIALQEGYGPLILHNVKNSEYFEAIRDWDVNFDTKLLGDMIWKDMTRTLNLYINCFTQETYFKQCATQ